ncbi:MAG: hypothetical protein D3908_06650 [Candidatus Electrothrix sp. AUS4]|nr:hypothetical protein [Candidatus Electrothrix sp. AUS4]
MLLVEASLRELKASFWEDKPEGHPLKWLLKYFLSSDEEARQLIEQGNYLARHRMGGRDAIVTVSRLLDSFRWQ